ncbi:MAG TPA: HAD family hydrolase [Bryobacteraceae bacterium]|nr:HAD family hydrolase [Bryobacteraceae bacterium]
MLELKFSCDAVLFDMDGTLVDSTVVVERMWRMWARRAGLAEEPLLKVMHGRRTSETMREVAPWLDTKQETAWFDALEELDTEGIVEVPGANALLAQVERWAVVTSAHRRLAKIRLGCAGLPVPALMVCGDEITRGKPDPEGYLKAGALLGVQPERCLVVEDAPAGVEAGRRAGMQVIALSTTHPVSAFAGIACVPDLYRLKIYRDTVYCQV